MKIFVCSTVKDLGDLRDELYRRLKELGHTPWFSEKDDFPINHHPDSMTNCIKVTEKCDLFVVLLDRRAGLKYTKREDSPYSKLFDLTISEAEYRRAREKDKPICIFIRKRVGHESAIYRQVKDKKQRESMKWYSDPAVYDFYDHLMHEKPHIPWRYTFNSIEEIMGPLNSIIGEVQPRTISPGVPLPPIPYFAHPYPLQKNFTGREKKRNELTNWLNRDPRPMLTLTAIGGMGKTALAWYWLQEDIIKQGLAPKGIIWWSFYDKESSFDKFVRNSIVYASQGEINSASIDSARERVDTLVQLLRQKHFLLVLDGFERVLRAYAGLGSPYQGDEVKKDRKEDFRACIDPNVGIFLQELTSGYPQTKILMTTRLYPKELDDLDGVIQKELTRMNKKDAVEFFKRQDVNGTRVEIEEVCNVYGYHPLCLRLLSGMVVKDMKYNGDIKAWKKHNPLPKLIPKEHHILELAYNSLDKKKQKFISKISAFRNPMDYDSLLIFNDFDSEEKFNDVLIELTERDLLFKDEKHNKFDLHPIVRKYCYDRLIDKKGAHSKLRDYFKIIPEPEKVESVDDLAPVIELYHHTVGEGRSDEAIELYRDRLNNPLYYRFGAYQTIIELHRALFPDGVNKPPRLKDESWQAWTLNSLANSYALSGQPRRAVPLFELQMKIREKQGDNKNLAIGLGNIAHMVQIHIGEFDDAECNLSRSIDISREIKDEFFEAVGHQELGKLLCYKGIFEESEKKLAKSTKYWEKTDDNQGICLDELYRSIRSLLMSNADEALNSAEKSRELAEIDYTERDIIQAEYLLGAAYLMKENIIQAEKHLTEALTRDRKINLVEFEPDILLEFAKLRFQQNHKEEALKHAQDALRIVDRCEYRLKQADIHNFLAEFYLNSGDLTKAKEHAEIAKERASCGYVPALEKAEELLREL